MSGTIIKNVTIEQMENSVFIMRTEYRDGPTEEIQAHTLQDLKSRYPSAFKFWDWRSAGVYRTGAPVVLVPELEADPGDIIHYPELADC